MPTYVYETIPENSESPPRQFEVFQRMSEETLTHDPVTGEPVRRIITAAVALRLPGLKRSTVVNKRSAAATACGCASGKPHKH